MSKNIRSVLVNPPRMPVNVSNRIGIKGAVEQAGSYPPIGLAYLAAVLWENGIGVKIVDTQALKMSPEETAETVQEEHPDIVGVTVFTTHLRNALAVCKAIKELCPSTKIVVGGPHIHPQHKEVIEKHGFIDFAVRGEGEITMLELIDAISNGADLGAVKGITFREGEDIVVTPDRPFIEDLDTLPFPARDLLPNHLYRGAIGLRESKFTLVTASRGCPFNCHFCSTPRFWPPLRRRSVGNILGELEHLCETYKVELVRFTDEALVVNRKWLTELCRGMVEKGLNEKIAWTCDGRVGLMSEDLLEEMKEAGCELIFYGIEFGNQRILDFSGKGTTIPQIRETIDMTRKAGISPVGNFMIGYPTETKETIQDTIDLARSLDIDQQSFSIVTPFPGTQLYEHCKENDLLRTENWDEYNYIHPERGVIKLRHVTDEELMDLYEKAESEFYYKRISEVWSAAIEPQLQLDFSMGRAEKAPKARYIYAVIPRIEKGNFGPIGIEGNTVYTISYEEISAAVHDCPLEPYQGDEATVKEMVTTHSDVVDAVWEEASTVLPMSFDVIVRPDEGRSAEDNVRKWLEDEYTKFKIKLDEFRDKVELGVQIFWDPEVITQRIAEENEEIRKLMTEMTTKSKGMAYFYQHKIADAVKKEMEAKADEDYRGYYERLREYAEDTEVNKIKRDKDRQMIMNLSLLVKKDRVRVVGEALAGIGEEEGVEVRFTGPWPPYSFAAKLVAIEGEERG